MRNFCWESRKGWFYLRHNGLAFTWHLAIGRLSVTLSHGEKYWAARRAERARRNQG